MSEIRVGNGLRNSMRGTTKGVDRWGVGGFERTQVHVFAMQARCELTRFLISEQAMCRKSWGWLSTEK